MWRAVFYKISASRKLSSKGLRKCHLQYLNLAQANKDRLNFLISVNLLSTGNVWVRESFCTRVSRVRCTKKGESSASGVFKTAS